MASLSDDEIIIEIPYPLKLVGETTCSLRRKDYLYRNIRLLSFFNVTTHVGRIGINKLASVLAERGGDLKTPVRIKASEITLTCNFNAFAGIHQGTLNELGNLVLVALYGNFEGYLYDLLYEHMKKNGIKEAHTEAINSISRMGWEGKFSKLSRVLGIDLGKRKLISAMGPIKAFTFLEGDFTNPIDFLECLADVRHRIVHSASRTDKELAEKYPQCRFQVGKFMNYGFQVNFLIAYFLQELSNFIDKENCFAHNIPSKVINTQTLMEWTRFNEL